MRLPGECSLLSVLLLLGTHVTDALKLKAEGRRIVNTSHGLQRRANMIGLTNTGDINYVATVTVGGKDFQCLIDTGSSDLWVAGSPNNAQDTGKSSDISYAIGSVKGPIKVAQVKFGGYTISRQAYLEITPDGTNKEGSGLIGLGPNSGSSIYGQMKPDTAGITVLDSIFAQNTSTPNFMTFALGRSEDPSNNFPGDFTVGEVMDNYTDVTNQPKLAVTDVPVRDQGDQHFQILMDKGGLLGPDNQPISIKTKVDTTKDDEQPTAIVDTGFSLSQVPKSVADALYSRFSGAEFANVPGIGDTYIVPCETEVNITFHFGGNEYPIHPLHATLDPNLIGAKNIVNNQGQQCCIGMFQPITFNKPTFDVILGMSFLRNVYALINYGDFVANNSSKKADPYIQFLSTTNKGEAHSEFVQLRLNGVDTTGQTTLSPFTPTDDGTSRSKSSKPSFFWYIVISASIAGGLFLLLAAYLLFRRMKRSRGKGRYAKLEDPTGHLGGARGQQMDMHSLPNMPYNANDERPYSQAQRFSGASDYSYGHVRGKSFDDDAAAYNPHSQASYNNPWDHRY